MTNNRLNSDDDYDEPLVNDDYLNNAEQSFDDAACNDEDDHEQEFLFRNFHEIEKADARNNEYCKK